MRAETGGRRTSRADEAGGRGAGLSAWLRRYGAESDVPCSLASLALSPGCAVAGCPGGGGDEGAWAVDLSDDEGRVWAGEAVLDEGPARLC